MHPVTHTGQELHPMAALVIAGGGQYFDAEHVERDPDTGSVRSLVAVDMFEGPRKSTRPMAPLRFRGGVVT